MAAITSAASGLASATTTWVGGVVPASADTVTIAAGDVVTVDGIYEAGGDVAAGITVNGTLSFSRTANTQLTCNGGIEFNAGSTLDIGTSASPITAYTAKLLLNKSATLAAGKYGLTINAGAAYTLYGAPRTVIAKLSVAAIAGATSITCVDAYTGAVPVGWKVGDIISLPSCATSTNASTREYIKIGAGYVSGSTIPVDSTLNPTGLVSYHAINCPALHGTSNVTITSYDVTKQGFVQIKDNTAVNGGVQGIGSMQYCAFTDFGGLSYARPSNFTTDPVVNSLSTASDVSLFLIDPSAQYTAGIDYRISQNTVNPVMIRCAVDVLMPSYYFQSVLLSSNMTMRDCAFSLRGDACTPAGNIVGGYIFDGPYFPSGAQSFATFSASLNGGTKMVTDTTVGYSFAATQNNGGTGIVLNGFDFNSTFYHRSTNAFIGTQTYGTQLQVVLNNPLFSFVPAAVSAQSVLTSDSYIKYVSINNDPLQQQEAYRDGTIYADSVTKRRSLTSAKSIISTIGQQFTKQFTMPSQSGVALTLVGSIQYDTNYGGTGFVAPAVSVFDSAGTLLASYSAPGAAPNAWHDFILSGIVQYSGFPEDLTVAFTTQQNTGATVGNVWFDGIPNSPVITKARHYGFLFDQYTASAIVNPTFQASESVAAAYTGMSITWGTTSTFEILTASQTFQKMYDYSQAQGCLNNADVMPFSGSGQAGNPSLTGLGNVTINTGYVLNGPGSINMGVFLLTTEFAGGNAYTYTGGAWGQLTTIPSFNGGQLNVGAAGTYNFTMAGPTIISMTPTAASTYNMGGSTFTGTADLRNTSAFAITVQLPTGTSYTTTNNTGGAITVSTPLLNQSVTINGLVAGSRIQIYDTTHATELYNGVVAGTTYTWTDTASAASNRSIRLRAANQSGVTAYNFVDVNIGTCGTTTGTAALSYLASQTLDGTYNLNAIDGSTVTGIVITATPEVTFSVPGGTLNNATIYAYQVYWQFTATGIAQENSFIASPDSANYIYTACKWKNTNATVPLTITGGWARDSVTGLTETLFDTTGYPIFAAANSSLLVTTGGGPLTTAQATQLANAATAANVPTNPLLTTDARLNTLDAAISTRLATAGYTAPNNAGIAAIPTNPLLATDTRLAALDATISSRLASATYVAPDNAGIAAIPTNPLLTNDARLPVTIIAAKADVPTATQNATAVLTAAVTTPIDAVLVSTQATQLASIPTAAENADAVVNKVIP